MKDKQEEGEQQSTKTTTRNNRADTNTHTAQHRSSQGRYFYKHQQQPEQDGKQEITGWQAGR